MAADALSFPKLRFEFDSEALGKGLLATRVRFELQGFKIQSGIVRLLH